MKKSWKNSKYKLKIRPNLESQFLQERQSKKETIEAHPSTKNEQPDQDTDEIDEKRIHCWVLVLPGARNVKAPFFIGL